MYSGKMHTREIDVTPQQLERWKAGALIQDIMPHLSADAREFLVNGLIPEETFGDC
jgi:hypothetical protein